MTAALALLLCLVLPGIAGGVLLSWSSDDPTRPGALVLRSVSAGVSAWLLSSGLLERTVGITKTSAWVIEGLLGVASVVVLLLPRSRAVLRSALAEAGYFAGLVAVTVISWLPMGLLVTRTSWGPLGSTPWYYWNLAQQVADAGRVPATATEWGTTLPFLADYRLFSDGTALMLAQGGDFYVPAIQAVTIVSAMLLGCGAGLLANTLGSGRFASLVAVVMAVTTGIGALRLTSYRPEGFGLGLTLLTVACFLDWFRRGERASLIAGCLMGVTLANVHGIALLAAAVMLVAAGVATIPRRGVRRHLLRVLGSGLALLVSVVLAGLVLGGTSGATQVGKLGNKSGLADPTWDFIRAVRGHLPSLPPSNNSLVEGAITRSLQAEAWVGIAVSVAVVCLVIGLITKQGVARRVVLFTAVAIAGLSVVAAVLALGWSSYVPRRTGSSRLVQEMSLLIGPFVACGVACLAFIVGGRSGETWRRALCAVLVVASCGLGIFQSARVEKSLQHQRPQLSDVRVLQRLGLSSDSVVLTNAYTEGYVPQVMGARGLLDGRAPYTYPSVLTRANRLLREAKTFYGRPCDDIDFLDRNHVSYVVVTPRRLYALGTSNLFAKNVKLRKLDECPRLTRVLNSPRLAVYRVD